MRTREQSKAQLMSQLANAKAIIKQRDWTIKEQADQIERLKEQKNERNEQITGLHKSLEDRELAYTRMKEDRDVIHSGLADLRKELHGQEQRIGDLLHEVRTWKEAFIDMQNRMRQMRKNFYQQAALAGELADNAYATVAPTNTADEAR